MIIEMDSKSYWLPEHWTGRVWKTLSCGCWSSDNEDQMGIVSRIHAIMSMNWLDWQGVLQKLRQIAWMDSVFSNEVKRLETRLN